MYACLGYNCGWTFQQIREMPPAEHIVMYKNLAGESASGTKTFKTQDEYNKHVARKSHNTNHR